MDPFCEFEDILDEFQDYPSSDDDIPFISNFENENPHFSFDDGDQFFSYNAQLQQLPSSADKIETAKCSVSKSRKDIYGKGGERKKLLNVPHFRESVSDCEIYKQLGYPTKDFLIELGNKYNIYFKTSNKSTSQYPQFGRMQKRNKGLAIWFLEDNKNIICPWLKSIGLLH